MGSKQVIDNKKSADYVVAAASTHAERIGRALSDLCSPHLEASEALPDVALLSRLLGRALAHTSGEMVHADEVHSAELSDDAEPRAERDRVAAELAAKLVELREEDAHGVLRFQVERSGWMKTMAMAMAALGVALAACGGGDGDSRMFGPAGTGGEAATSAGGAGGAGTSCIPGKQEACACPGGAQGAQACLADGSGYGACQCGSGGTGGAASSSTTTTGSALPPQPPSFALNAPANATTGTAFPVSWSVTGATGCTGSASRDGSSINLPGWTDTASPTSPRSVTASLAGAYTLTLTCSNAAGNTPSLPKSVAVSGGTGSCPPGRQTVADVCYKYGPQACANSTDVTKFENLWGRGSPSDPPIAFPGKQVFAIVKNMQKAQYLAIKFVAPTTPANQYGLMYTTETTSGPNTSYAISSECGDFTPSDSRCRMSNVLPGHSAGAWKLPGYSGPALCPLVPGETYYLNMRITDPTVTHFDCSGSTCMVGVTNNHTP